MDAKKEDKGKDTPELVPAPPVPARPSLLGRVAGVPWWLLRGLAKMNHETKAGLVVSASFLCLIGVVLYSKMKEQAQPAVPAEYQEIVKAGADGELHAELPGDPTPTSGSPGKGSGTDLSTVSDWHLNEVPGQGVIPASAKIPASKANQGADGLGGHQKKPTGQLADNSSRPSTAGQAAKKKNPPNSGYELDLNLNNDDNGLDHARTPDLGSSLGTHKAAPTTVIPPGKKQPQSNTFHLSNEKTGPKNEHGLGGLPVKPQNPEPKKENGLGGLFANPTPQPNTKPVNAATDTNHSALDSQHGSPATTFGQAKNTGATKQSQTITGQSSVGGQSWAGWNTANPPVKTPPASTPNGLKLAPPMSHDAAQLDLGGAHQMPTGTVKATQPAGGMLGDNKLLTTTGTGGVGATDHGGKPLAKNSNDIFKNSPAPLPASTVTQNPKPTVPVAGAAGQNRIVMPGPETMMGHSQPGTVATSGTSLAAPPKPVPQTLVKPVDTGVNLGQVVPAPATGAGLATHEAAPARPSVALAPLPRSPAPPMQVVQATPPPSTSRMDLGHSPPVGATPTVSTAPVAVPMPQSTVAPVTPRVASWDEEMYRFAAGDSFDQISQRYYGNSRYAQALLRFNRDRQPAADGLRLEPPVVASGGIIYIPPAKVLEEKYPNVISGTVRSAPTTGASLYPPAGTAPGAPRMYKVSTGGDTFLQIAQQTLHDENRWSEIYQLNPHYDPSLRIPAGAVLKLPADARIAPANTPS